MYYKEFVKKVAERSNISIAKTANVMKAFRDVIEEALIDGENITLLGLMSLDTIMTPEREYRNPRTGEIVPANPHARPRCRFSTTLKQLIKERG